MNIFILHENPEEAAKALCDKHVVKMILETAQMLCAVHPEGVAPYRRTHYNHPCTKWCRISRENYNWLIKHGYAICKEYRLRYGRKHKSQDVIEWCDENQSRLSFPETGLTEFAQAMPEEYKSESAVVAYRNFYIGEKKPFASWKHSKKPNWFE